MKILLVEDNKINCVLLSDYLEYCGYSVQAITCGELFFSTLRSFQPHLILLDLKMPRIDGYTLLGEMKSQPEWSHIPVIIISALSFRIHQAKAMQLGACRYLVKPIVPEVLKHVIQEELAKINRNLSILYPSVVPFNLAPKIQVS